ncbi:hypothetical protein [Butyrivibrio sp. VCB2006]|uniref:hypothetical protein n=1 Tax=Butyrivibrio sp. VCB2006 TaxID=1280679 RepID=UPI0004197801|nr:hypothetical protein [Butyrivibrio sp. VCB2006]
MGIKRRKLVFKKLRWPWANRKYKDTVFRLLFKEDRKALLDLYNAINHSHYNNPDELIVNTLDNAIFMGMHNDLSFIIDTHLNIYEHQSTKCPNIPLRCLFYVSSLYSQLIDEDKIYGDSRISIPEPHFVVFYNGTDEMPEEMTYRLSELYESCSDSPDLELTVKVLNINHGMNNDLMHSCQKLNEYSLYVAKVREYSQTLSLTQAVQRAIDYCIDHDILKDFLIKERKAVIMYSLYEYNKAGHMKAIKEESFEQGRSEGREEVRDELTPIIEEKDAVIASKDATIADKDATIATKDATIAELQAKIKELENNKN